MKDHRSDCDSGNPCRDGQCVFFRCRHPCDKDHKCNPASPHCEPVKLFKAGERTPYAVTDFCLTQKEVDLGWWRNSESAYYGIKP